MWLYLTDFFSLTSHLHFLAQEGLVSTTGHEQAHIYTTGMKLYGVANKNNCTSKNSKKSSPRVLARYSELTYLLNIL